MCNFLEAQHQPKPINQKKNIFCSPGSCKSGWTGLQDFRGLGCLQISEPYLALKKTETKWSKHGPVRLQKLLLYQHNSLDPTDTVLKSSEPYLARK